MQRIRPLAAVLVSLALALTACGEDEPAVTIPTEAGTAPGAGEVELSGSVSFAQPEDGAEVTSPVTIEATVEELELVPAGEPTDEGGHLHVMVDVACVQPGEVIPSDDEHVHLGDGSATTEIDLEPGEHTLCLQLGDSEHVATTLTDTVTVEVTG